jgi:hypothetical protein
MILAFAHPEICDEDELCRDIVEYEDVDCKPLLIVWGDASNPWNWEIAPEFLIKWAWLLCGCEDVLAATNYWRAKRCEPALTRNDIREAMQRSVPADLSWVDI